MSNGITHLLDSCVERSEGGFTHITLSGEPQAAAIVGAVQANYHRWTQREKPTLDDLLRLTGEKVTLIYGGENMVGAGSINAWEGTLFKGSSGNLAILPKGKRSKGYKVEADRVLDVLPGYNVAEATEIVATVRGLYPELEPLTQEQLEALPGEDETDMCSLAVFGSHPLFGSHDALWLIGEYWPSDDICDRSVLLIRPEHGCSEHGSIYGRDLLRNLAIGVVASFKPISFGEAVELCSLDYDEAVAQALGSKVAA